MRRQIFLLFFLFTWVFGSNAQDEEIKNAFQGTHLVNGQSANLAKDGVLNLQIQHRFGDISGGLYEFFGLDVASMRLGFEYGLGDHVNLGIGRSTWLKTYDAYTKFRLVRQKTDFPFTVVLNVGASVPTIRNYFPDEYNQFGDKLSWNAQLHVASTIGKFAFQLSPGFLRSGYMLEIGKDLSVFTLGTAATMHVSKKVSLNGEYLVAFDSNIPGENSLSFGVDIDTGGHLFQLVLSNNNQMSDQAVYTNTTGSWADGHLYFGFNLVREFNLKYKDLWTE